MSHSERVLRIINVDESVFDSELIEQELKKLSSPVLFRRVSTLKEFQTEIQFESCDIVISEVQGSDFLSSEIIEFVRNFCPDLPLLMVTQGMKEEDVVDLIKGGVTSVVTKSRLNRLGPVVTRILEEASDKIQERRDQKIANDAFAAKEQMLAIVSHDIKNPLFAIQLEAQMLLKAADREQRTLLSEEVRIQANRILKTSERMKYLITDLLDKNKSENSLSHLSRADTDILKILNDVVESLRPLIQQKEILLKTVLPHSKVMLSADRNKMFQVLANLINNAIKFAPNGGTIQVVMEDAHHDCIFSISDNGPGLSDKDLKRVFEKYWTGEDNDCRGTGLGLFICKTIVEAHGGMISVENNLEGGARFRFNLPKVTTLATANFTYYENQKDQRKKIYIVDDDEDLREVISWALGKEGHAVYSFHSPQEALDCLAKGHHRPHLIVVDFHMDEMKGSEFLNRKNEIFRAKDCPVVMISASPLEVEKDVRADFYKEVITKPIDLEGLVSNINKYLN